MFKLCGINGNERGLGNRNRSFCIDHCQGMLRYFSRNISEEKRTFENYKILVEKTFDHLCGKSIMENNEKFVCPVFHCTGDNFLRKISEEKLESFRKIS